ncbi:MAG: glycosyltransferase family 4 protein [Chthoniobacteraceae bacterium]
MPSDLSSRATAKPRLLVISASYVVSENRKKLAELARHFDLTCVTCNAAHSLGFDVSLRPDDKDASYRLIGLPTIGRGESTTRYFLRGLGKVIRQNPADVILVESEPWAFVRWQAWFWKWCHQSSAIFIEYSAETLDRPGWKGAVLGLVYRAAIATADFIIAITEKGGDLYRRRGTPEKRLLISNQLGIDETLFSPVSGTGRDALRRAAGFGPEDLIVGFCGRYVEQKGVSDLLAAVEQVRSKEPALPIRLLLLGAGPLQDDLLKAARDRPWLQLLPTRSHEEIARFMQTLDLFVLPSKPWAKDGEVWEEQLGHVLLEAMACGVACVGSDSGEIPVVIGEADAIFPAGDAANLAGKIRTLLTQPARRSVLAERQRARTLKKYTNRALATKWSESITRLLFARSHSVLWVDAHLEFRSPAMQHLLYALPHLRSEGWDIHAWCLRSDASRDDVEHTFFPALRWLGPFDLLYFTIIVNLYGLWRWISRRPRPAAIIHSTCGTYLAGDLISVHFINAVWAKVQCKLGFSSAKEFAKFLFGVGWIGIERIAWWSPTVRKILAVSESIAGEVRRRAPAGRPVEVFPNSYDESRFHAGVRDEYRAAVRGQLGLEAGQFAFIFVSQGHHERKGFWLAVAALHQLRLAGRKNIRFLVVGGTPETLDRLRARLATCAPDWAAWVLLTGMQKQVEKYYAAADAFLFPSHFEAFSLAEIEAAACGLPLLLTPHHGSEMTLNAGVSGAFLSYDPDRMQQQIGEFLDKELPPFRPCVGRGINRAEYATRLARIYAGQIALGRP